MDLTVHRLSAGYGIELEEVDPSTEFPSTKLAKIPGDKHDFKKLHDFVNQERQFIFLRKVLERGHKHIVTGAGFALQ